MKLSKFKIAFIIILLGYIPHIIAGYVIPSFDRTNSDFIFNMIKILKLVGYSMAVVAAIIASKEAHLRVQKRKLPASAKFLIPAYCFFAIIGLSWLAYDFLLYAVFMTLYGLSQR